MIHRTTVNQKLPHKNKKGVRKHKIDRVKRQDVKIIYEEKWRKYNKNIIKVIYNKYIRKRSIVFILALASFFYLPYIFFLIFSSSSVNVKENFNVLKSQHFILLFYQL